MASVRCSFSGAALSLRKVAGGARRSFVRHGRVGHEAREAGLALLLVLSNQSVGIMGTYEVIRNIHRYTIRTSVYLYRGGMQQITW